MPSLANFLSQLFGGGGGGQQAQPQQAIPPLGATSVVPDDGQQGQPPVPQGQQPQPNPMQMAQQASYIPQGPGALDKILQAGLPLISGFAAQSQLPRNYGPWSHIGAALGGGANTFMQMRQQQAQNELARAGLINTIQHQHVMEGQGQQGIDIEKEKAAYETKPAGVDITADFRTKNPMLDAWLPGGEAMKELPIPEQGKWLKSAVEAADAQARLRESMMVHSQNHEDRLARLDEMHQATQGNFQLRQQMIDNQVSQMQEKAREYQQTFAENVRTHTTNEELKKTMLENQQELTKLRKESIDNIVNMKKWELGSKQAMQGQQNLIKLQQDYNKSWKSSGLPFMEESLEDWITKRGYDPTTGYKIGKDGKPVLPDVTESAPSTSTPGSEFGIK